jgi:hypothetical protein
MAVQQDGDLHGDPALDAVERESVPVGFGWHSSSEARGNPREIFYIAAAGAMFHAVERAVSSAQKLFRRIAIVRKRGNTGANGKRGRLGFGGEAFANSGNDTGGNVRARFRKYESEFVAAITRGRIDGARMAAKNF